MKYPNWHRRRLPVVMRQLTCGADGIPGPVAHSGGLPGDVEVDVMPSGRRPWQIVSYGAQAEAG